MNAFGRFVDILLEEGGLQEIIDEVSREMRTGAAWKEQGAENAFCSGERVFSERMSTYPLREIMRLYKFREVRVSKYLTGYLVFDVPHSEDSFSWGDTAENCISAIRLFYGKKMAEDSLKSTYRDEFVQDLLYNRIRHEEELINRARIFHWHLEGDVICLIVSLIPHREEMDIPFDCWALIQSRIRAFFPQSVFTRMPQSIIFLLSMKAQTDNMRFFNARASEILETIRRDLEQRYALKVLASAGGYRKTPLLASESYQEARQALMILRHAPSNSPLVFWDQLGGARLIATLADTEAARDFCRQTLAPLMQGGHKNEELIRTLVCLEETGGNLRVAAKKLSLHYNSLKYRTSRIWYLLGIDPEDSEQRFNLSLALRIYRMMNSFL